MSKSSKSEEEGLREFLEIALPEVEIHALLKTTTAGQVTAATKTKAIDEIIKYSDAVSVLNRRKVKKEFLIRYLSIKNVKFSLSYDKTRLCRAILDHWKCGGETVKALQFVDNEAINKEANDKDKEHKYKLLPPLVALAPTKNIASISKTSLTSVGSASKVAVNTNADIKENKKIGILRYTVPFPFQKPQPTQTQTVTSSTSTAASSASSSSTPKEPPSKSASDCSDINKNQQQSQSTPPTTSAAAALSIISTPKEPSFKSASDVNKNQQLQQRLISAASASSSIRSVPKEPSNSKPATDANKNQQQSFALVVSKVNETTIIEKSQNSQSATQLTQPLPKPETKSAETQFEIILDDEEPMEVDIDVDEYLAMRQAEKDIGQNLGEKFSEWYYNQLNFLDGFVPLHFWPECNLRIELVSNNAIEKRQVQEVLHDGQKCFEEIYNLRTSNQLFFNPNLTGGGIGVRGKMNPHGLAQIIVCGTLHQHPNPEEVGVFEQIFGLLRDPFAENNFRIKFCLLRMREGNAIAKYNGPPEICDTTLTGTINEECAGGAEEDYEIGEKTMLIEI